MRCYFIIFFNRTNWNSRIIVVGGQRGPRSFIRRPYDNNCTSFAFCPVNTTYSVERRFSNGGYAKVFRKDKNRRRLFFKYFLVKNCVYPMSSCCCCHACTRAIFPEPYVNNQRKNRTPSDSFRIRPPSLRLKFYSTIYIQSVVYHCCLHWFCCIVSHPA